MNHDHNCVSLNDFCSFEILITANLSMKESAPSTQTLVFDIRLKVTRSKLSRERNSSDRIVFLIPIFYHAS
uniref:Ovule protein n=1 Tax=Caenorhabditis tropicalis TaxID=1561998 RepID=A0A1I7TZ10_9PELO